jgi:8-oxo-dGTP pyrophosphatase MutT (NUDIX family)
MSNATLRKVTAFVVDRSTRRLLVFRHPLAGVQLPAGSVELGEGFIAAARREVLEETGWTIAGAPQLLGVEAVDLGDERGVMLESVADGVTDRGGQPSVLARGHKVRVLRRSQRLVEVCEEIFDLTTSPPEVRELIQGWVPAHTVGAAIERGFVLFCEEPGERLSGRRSQFADGHTFEVYWALPESLALVAGQDVWLGRYQDQIAEACGGIKRSR